MLIQLAKISGCVRIAFSVAVLVAASVVSGVAQERVTLKQVGAEMKAAIESKKIDIAAPFDIEIKVPIENGRPDVSRLTTVRSDGNEAAAVFARKVLQAASDAGLLIYLKQLEAEEASFWAAQDTGEFAGGIRFTAPSVNRARTVVSALQMMLSASLARAPKEGDSLSQRDRELLKATQASANGREVTLMISLPTATAHKMLLEELNR